MNPSANHAWRLRGLSAYDNLIRRYRLYSHRLGVLVSCAFLFFFLPRSVASHVQCHRGDVRRRRRGRRRMDDERGKSYNCQCARRRGSRRRRRRRRRPFPRRPGRPSRAVIRV
ncbi:hypothetical protein PUN28_008403 [Cardiocondyla obscurior]|uniref:Uncharacterized protein n=1 Tax=Cardiocondyla obscurior TaxID=286306 RepID=A0AAW2FZ72_9HYME